MHLCKGSSNSVKICKLQLKKKLKRTREQSPQGFFFILLQAHVHDVCTDFMYNFYIQHNLQGRQSCIVPIKSVQITTLYPINDWSKCIWSCNLLTILLTWHCRWDTSLEKSVELTAADAGHRMTTLLAHRQTIHITFLLTLLTDAGLVNRSSVFGTVFVLSWNLLPPLETSLWKTATTSLEDLTCFWLTAAAKCDLFSCFVGPWRWKDAPGPEHCNGPCCRVKPGQEPWGPQEIPDATGLQGKLQNKPLVAWQRD